MAAREVPLPEVPITLITIVIIIPIDIPIDKDIMVMAMDLTTEPQRHSLLALPRSPLAKTKTVAIPLMNSSLTWAFLRKVP